ncbi:MAG: hypothetical protein GX774_03490 [Armatimonadetes bacterium]|nr:hypothetical protein [Armatimonadota bacterium]
MLRIGLYWEEAFPTVDATPPALNALRRALEGFDLRVLGFSDLERLPALDLLILPFGSAFPMLGWPQIVIYLQAGGNLLTLGGTPFAVPCTRQHIVWQAELRQPAYHQELGIRQYATVDGSHIPTLEASREEPILSGLREPIRVERAFEAILWPADGQAPAAHTRDRVVRPLLYGRDASGRLVAAPIVALDHVDGEFAGGRWVLANLEGRLPRDAVRRLAFYGALGASDLTVTPSFACYFAGEQPRLTVHATRLGPLYGRHAARVSVTDPNGVQRTCELPPVSTGTAPAYRSTQCDGALFGTPPLPPGLYTVEATLVDEEARDLAARLRIPPAASPGLRRHRNGFWVWDDRLATGASTVTVADALLHRDGLPHFVLGTSYPNPDPMADSLADPNPHVWDADLKAMKEAGVSLLRVGTWMDRRRAMPEPGLPDEGYLRAVDALILTACKHDLPVLFTLFTYPPEAWDGANRYLDPRTVAAQQDFVAALISRYRQVESVLWEVTDTPSLLAPARLPEVRPSGDPYEEHAWREWLSARPEEAVRADWRATPRAPLALPSPADFTEQCLQVAHPLKVVDYRLFAQEVYQRWQNEIRNFIRVRTPLPALAADGGGALPPAPATTVELAYAHAHCDDADLLWRALLARARRQPALIDGAAGRLSEGPDRRPRVGDAERRDALERVLTVALTAGCAGVIRPAWGVNVPCNGAVSLGLVRDDGTADPELEALSAFSRFVERNRQHLAGREPEPAVMVVPQSGLLSPGSLAIAATQACVQAFHQASPVGLRAVNEYTLADLGEARLILLPAARLLRQEAWEALLEHVATGATLLITGPIDEDEHWQRRERLAELGLAAHTHPVAREESVLLEGRPLTLRFGGDKPYRVDKAVLVGRPAEVTVVPHGHGRLLFAPLPFELADSLEPLVALYAAAVAYSGLPPPFTLAGEAPGVLVRALWCRQAVLYGLISQCAEDRQVEILHGAQAVRLTARVPARRAVLLLVDRDTGVELDRHPSD